MNEQYPGAEPLESTPPSIPYKDRSTGLVVFGILTILLGCMAGLLVLLILAGQAISATTTATNPQVSFSSLLPAIFMYATLGMALIWLGIGSIKARRWARALLLIFSWSWLVIGVVGMISAALVLPKVLANLPASGTTGQPALPAAALDAMMAFMFLTDGVIFIILPAIWTFFYSSRHVKATCEWHDSTPRWTDACPLPVLGLCLWLMFSALMLLIMPMAGIGVAPFFGVFLTGRPGMIFYLILAALWSCSAWLLYRLDRRGWWLILIALCLFWASSLLTYSRHDVMEVYHLMGYPEAQIEQIQKLGLMNGNTMTWMTSLSMLPFLAYLFFIKKYFPRKR